MAGIKIIGVKVVGLCSKCRKDGDEIPKNKDGSIIPDKDISCINTAFGNCENTNGRNNYNGDNGEADRLCCFCGAKEYNSTLGILHKRECAIIKLRKDIAEAKSQTN